MIAITASSNFPHCFSILFEFVPVHRTSNSAERFRTTHVSIVFLDFASVSKREHLSKKLGLPAGAGRDARLVPSETVEGLAIASAGKKAGETVDPFSSYPIRKAGPMKTFTLEEAQSLLPVLESLLKRAMESRRSAQTVESSLNQVARQIYLSGGMRVNSAGIAKQRAEVEEHLKQVRESIAEMDAIGVQVKDLDTGLLDFPCRVEDELVLLCWRLGETAIEHWHTVESGFQSRQPVDERFRRRAASGGRPN
jgi:hypothetical protein